MHNAKTVLDIGESLAAAREAEGLSLDDAERLTCLRQRYLVALERNDFELLPGRTYARTFLRTYAEALGIDGKRLVAKFDEVVPPPEEDDLVVVLPRVDRSFPLRALAGAVAVAGLIAAVAWAAFSPGGSTPDPGPPPVKAATSAAKHAHAVLGAQKAHAPRPPQPQPLLIHAVDGTCWLLVRKGGASGPVLYEGTIEPGQTLHFAAHVWVRLGAPWNVTVRRGSHTYPATSQAEPQNLVA